MRATGYVAVGTRIYAPGEELPDDLDNVNPADHDEAILEAPAPEPAAPADDTAGDPSGDSAPTVDPTEGDESDDADGGDPAPAPALPADKAGLVALAESLGLDTSGTKAVLTDRIVAAQAK